MLVSYKEKKKLLLISLLLMFLDGIIVYYVPSYFNNLNYLYPMLTISFIPFLVNKKDKINYICLFISVIYDLLYSNILLYNVVLFYILYCLDKTIIRYFKDSFFIYLILGLLNIIVYDIFSFILVFITNYQSVSINDLFYKITNSLLLNIMSIFMCFFLVKNKKTKHII